MPDAPCESTLLVISGTVLDETTRSALTSAAQALGYEEGCCFATLDEAGSLSAYIAAADPWAVVLADDTAIEAARETAFAGECAALKPDAPVTVRGYTFVAVPAFSACLDDQPAKRVAWNRLKAAAHPGNPLD